MFYILLNSINSKSIRTSKLTENKIHSNQPLQSSLSYHDEEHMHRDSNHFHVDCSKSTSGVFSGIFIMLVTIISLITYFIYKKHNPLYAEVLTGVTELSLISLSMFLVILTWINLKYKNFRQSVRFEKKKNQLIILF